MKKIIDYLQQLDLSESEAMLYVALLQHGAMNVRDLARTVGIKRTTAYLYIDQLVEKGLLLEMVKGSQKQVMLSDPEVLRGLVEKKVSAAKEIENGFGEMLKIVQRTKSRTKGVPTTEIKYYKGVINARKIYEEALSAKEVRAYARVDKEETLWPDNTTIFNKAFRKNKQLKMWEIIYGQSAIEVSENINFNTDRYFYKFMPRSLRLSSEDILIYDGKVAIINFRGGGTNIVLQSIDFYNNLKELFDFMWKILPDLETIIGEK